LVPWCLGGERSSTPARGPPPGLPAAAYPLLGRRAAQAGGTVYEPCYDDPPAAAESNDQASTADEQVFPNYDQYDPGPVYD
jgi:hypothetical protein